MAPSTLRRGAVAVALAGALAATGATTAMASRDVNPDYQYLYKHTIFNATARGAVCNDGTPAVFYYRNCTANGDRHAGDPTNYCEKGGAQGVQSVDWFVYLDPADSLWCHDAESCTGRDPQLQTSNGLPDRLFLSGWFSPYPEQNPNFYKQHSVYIPSCSSDLFVGTGGGAGEAGKGSLVFAGKNIVRAVLEDLQSSALSFEGITAPLTKADEVIVGGGAGAMLLVDDVRSWLPAGVTRVRPVCDGCLIPDIAPATQVAPAAPATQAARVGAGAAAGAGAGAGAAACTDAADCPPATSLAAAVGPWGFKPPAWCSHRLHPAECFRGDVIIGGVQNMLVQQPQLNTVQLRQFGAAVGDKVYATKYAAAVQALAASATFAFSVGCATNGTSLMTDNFYYFDQLNCTSGAPPFPFALTQVVAEYLTNPTTTQLHCVQPTLTFANCSDSTAY